MNVVSQKQHGKIHVVHYVVGISYHKVIRFDVGNGTDCNLTKDEENCKNFKIKLSSHCMFMKSLIEGDQSGCADYLLQP